MLQSKKSEDSRHWFGLRSKMPANCVSRHFGACSALTRRINKNTHMKRRLFLTTLCAVLAFLTPASSTLYAQVLAATKGIDAPELPRKCIKPKDRAPVITTLLAPLACLEPVVNVSATSGNQSESFMVTNPTNTSK